VQKVSTKRCNEGQSVEVVMRRGARTWADMKNEGKNMKQWVRKSACPMPSFDPKQ